MKAIFVLTILCASTLAACGNNDAGSDDNNGDSNNAKTNNAQPKDKSSFKAKAKDDAGEEQTVENEIENDKASKQMGGASIADSVLSIFLIAPNGDTIQAIIETTESVTAPGSFTVGQPPEGTFVTWLLPTTGEILESTGGSIVLDSCPKTVGTQVKGSLKGVTLASVVSGSTTTLDGNFDMQLFAKNGDLFCKTEISDNNGNNSNNGGTCDYTEACDQTDGSCCPFLPCLSQCQLTCFQTPACSDPFNPDLAACAECSNDCLDSCNVDTACRNDNEALTTCEDNAGCDAFGDEDEYDVCVKGSCCAEVKAAF